MRIATEDLRTKSKLNDDKPAANPVLAKAHVRKPKSNRQAAEAQETRGVAAQKFAGRTGAVDEAAIAKAAGKPIHGSDPASQTRLEQWKTAHKPFPEAIRDARKVKYHITGCAYFFKEDGLIHVKQPKGDLKALMPRWQAPLAQDADLSSIAARISDQLIVDLAAAVVDRRKLTGTSHKNIAEKGAEFIVGFWPEGAIDGNTLPNPLKIIINTDRSIQVAVECYDGGTRAIYGPGEIVPSRLREDSTAWVPVKTVTQLPDATPKPEPKVSTTAIRAIEAKWPNARDEFIIPLAQVAKADGSQMIRAYEQASALQPKLRYQIPLALAQASQIASVPVQDAVKLYEVVSEQLGKIHYEVATRLAHTAVSSGKSSADALAAWELSTERFGGNYMQRAAAAELALLTRAGQPGLGDPTQAFDTLEATAKVFADAQWSWRTALRFGQAVVFSEGAVTPAQSFEAAKYAVKRMERFTDAIPVTLAEIAVANMKGVPADKVEKRLRAEIDNLIKLYKDHAQGLDDVTYYAGLSLAASRGATNPGASFLALMRPWIEN